ncbi:MAG: DEAD/DEAH box helicase, partial [Actinomycetota bacterium]
MASASASLDLFSPVAKRWFEDSFEAPTPAQEGAWKAIAGGEHTLVIAPTGSGKTLAAFLWSLDRLAQGEPPRPKERLRTLYVSPLKALAVDIERNLRSPLAGMKNAAARLGAGLNEIEIGVRTGDTSPAERRRHYTHPPDILITTPESLFLVLTSQAREALAHVDTVIIDEIHALAGSKRGSHLALSLERLDALLKKPAQRIGLSATVRPAGEVARFMGGSGRKVEIVSPAYDKQFDLRIVVGVEDMANLGEPIDEIPVGRSAASDPPRRTIWPSIEEQLVELVGRHRSTIIFTNSRFLSERLCARINELAGGQIARSHHGSVSKQQRLI